MTESSSEVSSNLEVLEDNDEGKKKSKFKAFKSFFVNKKKKETEDALRRRMLKPSLSGSNIYISSLEPVQEGELNDPRNKSGMGNKALSHESIFMLDTEPERSANEMYPSTEFQRGRTLRRSQPFKTLPRSGAVPGTMPRSGVWVAGSKITEIPPLRPRPPSLSPPLIRSDTISKDLEEISIDDESPKSPQMKASSKKILTEKKSLSESSSGPSHSRSSTACASPSSTQQLAGFSSPATSKSCLDSSAAQHKIALNPRKQQKKSLQGTVDNKKEEPDLSVVSEREKSTTKPKEADLKKVKIEGAGHFGQEQSNNTEIYDQKTMDKSTNTNAAGNLSNPVSAAHGRRCKRVGTCVSITNQYGTKGRSFTQSSQSHGLGDRPESPSTDKTARDGLSWHPPSEKQALEQLTTSQAEITISQELLSDKSDMRRRNASVDFEAKKALASQSIPEDTKESMVSGPPPNHEDGASLAKMTESRTSLLPVVRRPSTTPKKAIFLVTTEAQVLRDPSPIQSEEEEASSLGLQNVYSKTENVPTVSKEKPPGNVLQDCTVSISNMTSTTEEGGMSMEKLETAKVSPDSKSVSEKGNDSEKQLATGHAFQSFKKPKDEQKVFEESEILVVELNSVEQQLALGYSSQFLRKPEPEKGSPKSESTADRESIPKEAGPGHSSQSLGKHRIVFSESESFLVEQLAPRCSSQVILEPEDKEISTGSNGYVKKYNNAEDWHSSEEGLPLRYPNQALEKPEDQQEVPSVPKNAWEEQMPSKCPIQSIVRPIVQPHISSNSVTICAEQHGSVEPVTPGHPFQTWVNPEFVQLVSADEESAVEWGGFMEPLPHRMTSKYLMNPTAEQKSSSGPVLTSMAEVSMEVLPPRYSPPLTRPIVEQEASEYPESTSAEGRIYMALRHPSHPFQQWVSPQIEQVFSSSESPTVEEGGIFVEPLPPGYLPQPLMNCIVQQSMSSGSEGVAAEAISVEPQYSKYSLPNPQVQPIYSESTGVEQGIFVEQLPLGCHCQALVMPKFQPQMSLESVNTSAQWCNAVKPVPARHICKIWICPGCKQQGSVGPQSIEAEWGISEELVPPRDPGKPWLRPTFEQVSAGPETTAEWNISMGPQLPRMPSQPPRRSVVKQPVFTGLVSTAGQWNSSVEQMPPGHPFQPWASSTFQQQVSAGLESTATEGNISMDLEPSIYCQPLRRPIIQQEISNSMNTSEEWCGPLGPVSSRYPFQPWPNPKFEQQVSAGPENVAMEGNIPRELPRHLPQATVRQQVQKMSSSLESATIEGGISEESLSPKHPTYFLVRSEVQEIPSILESTAAEESISKKLWLPKSPPGSFSKFMAQQIFSESSDAEREIYVDPLSPNLPSKSLLSPEIEHQIFSDWENPDIAEGISLKPALKSLGWPADPQEGLSFSERASMKQSSSKWQGPSGKAPGKLKYQQEASSLSDISSEEWRSSEVQSRHPFEALYWSEFQPPTGSVNIPVEWSDLEEHQPPRHLSQAFRNAEYQQQVYSSAMSATAEVTISENNPGSWSLPKGPVSPKKTKKHSQGSKYFPKSIPTSAPKPGNFITAPTWKIPISGDTYYKEEILQSGDRNNDGHSNLPTNEADVENLSGVQWKRMSSPHKYKNEKPDSFTQLPSLLLGPISSSRGREQQMRRGTSQVHLNTTDNLTTQTTFVEKHQSRAKYEGVAKKQPTYKTPVVFEGQKMLSTSGTGKEMKRSLSLPSGLQNLDESVELKEPAEPVWFSMAKKKAKAWSHIAEVMQ
ncbi:hypothetical protein GW7_07391 [Heterocephalus glaber]|uniref:DUF4592 domain-containing protein n=1 Tax=Heterocephalus glaber TaxID=10181 RepID=G5BU60_HETGA|nr:hypothetical protein GW7_07391 [Heterocephalus glaber]